MTDLHVGELRLGKVFLNWLLDNRSQIGWNATEGRLMQRIEETPRRKDGSLILKVDLDELGQLKVWAAWAIHVSTPQKGQLGAARSLFNSAKGLLDRTIKISERTRA